MTGQGRDAGSRKLHEARGAWSAAAFATVPQAKFQVPETTTAPLASGHKPGE